MVVFFSLSLWITKTMSSLSCLFFFKTCLTCLSFLNWWSFIFLATTSHLQTQKERNNVIITLCPRLTVTCHRLDPGASQSHHMASWKHTFGASDYQHAPHAHALEAATANPPWGQKSTQSWLGLPSTPPRCQTHRPVCVHHHTSASETPLNYAAETRCIRRRRNYAAPPLDSSSQPLL
jgi:hypothetical protein